MTERRRITPVILSGGSGTRLWPVSRTGRPKQLLALTAEQTMLELTIARTLGDARFGSPIVVANAAHATDIEAQLASAGAGDDALVILEPAARNTAPAIALAALAADPDDLLLVMPSDHVIADGEAFRAAIARAVPVVEDGWLATFGIAATAPETGYGYICRGDEIADGVHKVDRFVEKPDLATAQGISSRAATAGTAASSCSPRRRSWRRWTRWSRRSRAPPARRWRVRGARGCGCIPTRWRSAGRRANRWTMR